MKDVDFFYTGLWQDADRSGGAVRAGAAQGQALGGQVLSRRVKTQNLLVEGQLPADGRFNTGGGAKTVALIGKGNVFGGNAFLSEGIDHGLSLAGRYDFILQPLKKDHRQVSRSMCRMGRALLIQRFLCRVGADQ